MIGNENRPAPSINELPITQQGESLFVSAILLHKKLEVQTKFSMWIQRRIDEYGFEKGSDYFPNLGSKKVGRGNFSTDYFLSLDTAKELGMLEKNEIGRSIRRYFIEIEKRYRDWIGFILPRLTMDRDLFGQREGYIYLELLEKCQLSLKSGSRSARLRKNPQEFWRNSKQQVCVSETYGRAIITNAIARRLNVETKSRRLTYTGQSLQTQGGTA